MGSAAIHALKLDEQLGGFPVQYRQVQDHESPLFMACFPNGKCAQLCPNYHTITT